MTGERRRILVVEDEPLVAMDIEDVLGEMGVDAVGPASSVEGAMAAVTAGGLDGALLDVNLRGEPVTPVADALAASGTPFVFLTGYGPDGIPAPHRGRPLLIKPFRPGDLVGAVQRYFGPLSS